MEPQDVLPPSEHHESAPVPHHPRFGYGGGRHTKKRLMIIVGIVLGVVLVAAAAFFVLSKQSKQPATQKNTPAQQTTKEQDEPAMPEEQASVLKTFKSTKQNIEIAYRTDWTLKEANDGQLTLTSPSVRYETAVGEKKGVFTLKIRIGATEAMQATVNKAVAVKDSEVIGYTNPTEAQRYYTNLSYGGTDEQFQFMIVTGSTSFKTGSAFDTTIGLDDSTYLLVGGYGADTSNSLLFDAVPVMSTGSDVYDQAIAIIKSLRIF